MVYRLHYEDCNGQAHTSTAIYNIDAVSDLMAEARAAGLKVTKIEAEQDCDIGPVWTELITLVEEPGRK